MGLLDGNRSVFDAFGNDKYFTGSDRNDSVSQLDVDSAAEH